jgi:hypothetical protein
MIDITAATSKETMSTPALAAPALSQKLTLQAGTLSSFATASPQHASASHSCSNAVPAPHSTLGTDGEVDTPLGVALSDTAAAGEADAAAAGEADAAAVGEADAAAVREADATGLPESVGGAVGLRSREIKSKQEWVRECRHTDTTRMHTTTSESAWP